MRSWRVVVFSYLFGHNMEGLTFGHVGCKYYEYIMTIGIIVDLNLYTIIVILPLYGYLLGARTSPLGILLPCTALSGIKVKVVPECVDKSPKVRLFAPGLGLEK